MPVKAGQLASVGGSTIRHGQIPNSIMANFFFNSTAEAKKAFSRRS